MKTAKSHCCCQIKGFKTVLGSLYLLSKKTNGPWPFVFENCQNLHNHFKSYHFPLRSQQMTLNSFRTPRIAVSAASAFDGFYFFCLFKTPLTSIHNWIETTSSTGLGELDLPQFVNRHFTPQRCETGFDLVLKCLRERGVKESFVKGVLFSTHLMLHWVFHNRKIEWNN